MPPVQVARPECKSPTAILQGGRFNPFTGQSFADDRAKIKLIIDTARHLAIPQRIQRHCHLNHGGGTNGKCLLLRVTQQFQAFLIRVVVIANVIGLVPNEKKLLAKMGTNKNLFEIHDTVETEAEACFAAGKDDWGTDCQRVSTIMSHDFIWVRWCLRHHCPHVTWDQVSTKDFGNAMKGLRARVHNNGSLWSVDYMVSAPVQANLTVQMPPNNNALALTGHCCEWVILFDQMVSGFRDQALAGRSWGECLLLETKKVDKFCNDIGNRWHREG